LSKENLSVFKKRELSKLHIHRSDLYGCLQTPLKDSKFCENHQDASPCSFSDIYGENVPEEQTKRKKECQKSYPKAKDSFTAGLFVSVCPCGFVESFEEMINAESLTALYCFLRDHYEKLPKYIVYDNACKFKPYVSKRPPTDNPTYFTTTTFCIDRFHAVGHVESCKTVNSASCYSELEGFNTSAAEQTWVWLNRMGKILKHMNQRRFKILIWIGIRVHNQTTTKTKVALELENTLINVGDRLEAQFDCDTWYCGVVLKVTEFRVLIRFDDGISKTLDPSLKMRRCGHILLEQITKNLPLV